jgi:hypothetical protein
MDGVKTKSTETCIITNTEFDEIAGEHDICSFTELDSDHMLVEYETIASFDRCSSDDVYFSSVAKQDSKSRGFKSSVGIASAITGYARIKAHRIKMVDPTGLVPMSETSLRSLHHQNELNQKDPNQHNQEKS